MTDTEREPVEVKLDDMSDDALKALIDTGDLPADAVKEPEPTQPESDADAKEEQPDEQPAADEPTAEPPESEPETIDDLAMLRLQLEEANKRVQHFEKTAGRVAGEKGFLQTQLKKQESDIDDLRRLVAERIGDGPLDDEPSRAPAPRRHESPATSETNAAVTQMLMKQSAEEFLKAHPESLKAGDNGQLEDDMVAALGTHQAEIEGLLHSPPIEAARRLRNVMDTAWSQVDLQRTVKRREDHERRRADSAQSLKEKKRAAAVTPSSGAPAGPPPKQLDPMTMPLKDLKALIERQNEG